RRFGGEPGEVEVGFGLGLRPVALDAVLRQKGLELGRKGVLGIGDGFGVKRGDAESAGKQRDEGARGEKTMLMRHEARSRFKRARPVLLCKTEGRSFAIPENPAPRPGSV